MESCQPIKRLKEKKKKYMYYIVTVPRVTRILNFYFSPNKALDVAGNMLLLRNDYG
jgi:hypothetical protein